MTLKHKAFFLNLLIISTVYSTDPDSLVMVNFIKWTQGDSLFIDEGSTQYFYYCGGQLAVVKNPVLLTVFKYDGVGNKIEETNYLEKYPSLKWEIDVKIIWIYNSLNSLSELWYYKNGNRVQYYYFYEYYSNNKLYKISQYDSLNTLQNYTVYHYDSLNNSYKMDKYQSGGVLILGSEAKLDTNGKVLAVTYYDSIRIPYGFESNSYDSAGHLVRKTLQFDSITLALSGWKYDENSNLLSFEEFKNGKYYRIDYEYNAKNSLLKVQNYGNDTSILSTENWTSGWSGNNESTLVTVFNKDSEFVYSIYQFEEYQKLINNCSKTDSVLGIFGLNTEVAVNPGLVGQVEAIPNPLANVTMLKLPFRVKNATLAIIDLCGRVIETRKIIGTNVLAWDASKYANGVYFYKIFIGKKSFSGALVKLK